MHRLCQGRLVLKGGENLFGWDSLAFQISHTHRLCRGRLGGENLSVWDYRWSSSSPICTGCADQAGAHRGGEFELVHVRGSAVHVCMHRGWRVYVALNFAASPHLVQLVVDFVKNECSVIVNGVLFHHLMNCDLVREEEGGKKVKRKGGRGGRERVGGQGRREEEGGGGGGRTGKREEKEGGGRGRRRERQ